MFCTKCGAQIPADARFCPACGMQQEILETPYARPMTGRIVRPREGRMIAGVCLGVARHLSWDVTLVRIILVVLAIAGAGSGVIAYIIGWIVIPEEPYALPVGAVPPPPPPVA